MCDIIDSNVPQSFVDAPMSKVQLQEPTIFLISNPIRVGLLPDVNPHVRLSDARNDSGRQC